MECHAWPRTSLVLLFALSTLHCTGSVEEDAGPRDGGISALDAGSTDAGLADAGPADAGPADAGLADAGRADAGPPAPVFGAIARVEIDNVQPQPGELVNVSWTSEDADRCVVDANRVEVANGLSGSVPVAINGTTTIDVFCEPFGIASQASMTIAPACQSSVTYPFLQTYDGFTFFDINGEEVAVSDDDNECIDVTGEVLVDGLSPVLARFRHVGSIFSMFASDLAVLPRLESGRILLDYDNGGVVPFLPFSYPLLNSGSFRLVAGTVDLRNLDAPAVFVDRNPVPGEEDYPVVLDLPATVSGVNVVNPFLPYVRTVVTHVTGNVTIRGTEATTEEIDAFVASLGTIDGTLTTCGNADDAPCN